MSEASLRQPRDVLGLAQVDDVGGGVDLVRRAQPLGERLQLVAAAGGEPEMAAFLGEGFGGGRADALRCAGDEDALAAQMQIHGITRCMGRSVDVVGGNCQTVRPPPSKRSTLHCSVAPRPSLVHCNPIK